MKKNLLIFNFIRLRRISLCSTFLFFMHSAFPQAGEWVWIKGDSLGNQPGNFGVQGVPNPANNPPGFYEPCVWKDLNGNFWLFGGMDFNAFPYNDLWKYDPVSNEWTWMKGQGVPFPTPVFGTQGVSSPANNPPGTEYGVAAWTDAQSNFWLFEGAPNNLWKYTISINEWTWMKGPGINTDAGIYGVKGVPDPANYPGARTESVSAWTDNANNLWLFGGQVGNNGEPINDLWKYDISNNTWTWMKGDSVMNNPGHYGSMGIEDSINEPPARWAYTHWKDSTGNLWLFGGGIIPSVVYNDLWRFNPSSNNWTWVNGNTFINPPGHYGSVCNIDLLNMPVGRLENPVVFTDTDYNFWLFGGVTVDTVAGFLASKNDLWKYCVANNKWIWMEGDTTLNPPGNWGVQGVSSPANQISGRMGSVGWFDNNNHFYFFGGDHFFTGRSDDIWKFTIDTACGVCPTPNSIEENSLTNTYELLVFPNPTNSSLTVSFHSSEKQNIELRMYSTLDKQIYFSKQEITKGKFEKEINVEKWSCGIYFLQLKTKNGTINKKVIVNHFK